MLKDIKEPKSLDDLNFNETIKLQRLLNKVGYQLTEDGQIGPKTKEAFKEFKRKNQLSLPDWIGEGSIRILKEKAENNDWTIALDPIKHEDGRLFVVKIPRGYIQEAIGEEDLKNLASEYQVSLPAIKAVIEVEAAGSGFLLQENPPSRPKILFEGHIFYRETPKQVSKSRPDLSYQSWTKRYYRGGSFEWKRLTDAMAFDPIPALRSASWGLGQIMGFNHELAGCETIEQLVIEAHKSEYHQARHIFNFCKNHPKNLIKYLQKLNWNNFAYFYNGAGYKKNAYHIKLAKAYEKHS